MRTYVQKYTGCEATEYTKEESEKLFGPIKQRVFHVDSDEACLMPLNDRTEALFKNRAWPCLILPCDFSSLKRDVTLDGETGDLEELMECYGERADPLWYRDDITPFLDILAARGTEKLVRWSFQGQYNAIEVPVSRYDAQKTDLDSNGKIDGFPPEWIFHDRFGDWGLYSDTEYFCLLAGEEPLMRAYIDKMGGWSAYRDFIDTEFHDRKEWDPRIWYDASVRCLYRIARWSWPFKDVAYLYVDAPFEPYEPYEPLAD